MDNRESRLLLEDGAEAMELSLNSSVFDGAQLLIDALQRWNRQVNLTAVVTPREVVEKHFIDSWLLLKLPALPERWLDIGCGPGFPGLPLALALPSARFTLVETSHKKCGFVKHAIVQLGLARRVRCLCVHAEGHPAQEGVGLHTAVISRAFTDVSRWIPLASTYRDAGGHVFSMCGPQTRQEDVVRAAEAVGLQLAERHAFELPWSRAPRSIYRCVPRETSGL